jgi:glycosyltransferase involved in cell wall biosynthesis
MSTLEVTIVLPAHGNASFLMEALTSISNQEEIYRIKECIIVFDRIEPRVEKEARLRCTGKFWRFLESSRPGIVNALNLGINASGTDLIARMDADDLMCPTRIRNQLLRFEDESSLVLLGTQIEEIDENGKFLRLRTYPVSDFAIRKNLLVHNVFAHSSVMFRKDIFLEAGGYREFYELAEDYDLWLRISDFGKVSNLDSIEMKYRIHHNQISIVKKRKQLIAELGAKLASKNRRESIGEPSSTYGSSEDWWFDWTSGLSGFMRKIKFLIRLKYYTSQQPAAKYLALMLLLLVSPSQMIKVSLKKLKGLISL